MVVIGYRCKQCKEILKTLTDVDKHNEKHKYYDAISDDEASDE